MKEISIGRFLRIILLLIFLGISYAILRSLSEVLLPFFVAWLLAYLIYPIVKFFQHKLRFKYRLPAIITVLLLLSTAILGIFMLVVPSFIDELSQLKNVATDFIYNRVKNPTIPAFISEFIREYADESDIMNILQSSGIQDVAKSLVEQTWLFAKGTINVIIRIFASCITLMYLFFILLDYERLADEWQTLIPVKWRKRVNDLMSDLTEGMNQYFRGQALIALLVGIMFSIGFIIIDFPIAIGFGLFIGMLNLVPYLQLVSLLPMTLLALIKAANTGDNFWIILFSALAVTLIIQAIQDFILVPQIMGRRMKLHPAVILLSLAVWGKLLGIIGMIVALPLTTLILGYIKQLHQPNLTTKKVESDIKNEEN
jgi:predicted PurR-regulated permease PerM